MGVYCGMVGRGVYFEEVGTVNLLGRSAEVIISLWKIGGLQNKKKSDTIHHKNNPPSKFFRMCHHFHTGLF